MKSALTNKDGNIDLMPLYMSLIAGMSTCLGAVWVLFQRKPSTSPSNNRHGHQPSLSSSSSEPVVSPSTMCFSLALAGSVMITVSVVSIIPECLREEEQEDADAATATTQDNHDNSGSYHMIPFLSMNFLYRLIFHIIGYVLYFLLAKFAFPEPDEILQLTATDTTVESLNNMMDAEMTQDLLLLRTTISEDSTSTTTTNCKEQQHSTTKARNRRLDSRTNSLLDLGSKEEEDNNSTSISNNNNHHHNNNNNNTKDGSICNKENNKPPHDLFRTLSRYSSGADLDTNESKRAWRVAMLLFVSLSVHNFPEGLAVAASAMESPQLGLKVTIGIMVHNIPEGVSIAVPCIAARPDSPWLAFWLSALSGLAEPFGAFVALFALRQFDQYPDHATLSPDIFNMENVLAFVAGIMIMVAVAELFPEAMRHTKESKVPLVAGTVAGIILMLATELYLA